MNNILNIRFKNGGLSSKLSNLYPHQFEIDGHMMESYEGFIQSLRTNNIIEQKKLWKMSGFDAWKYAQQFDWTIEQKLYWGGKVYDRHSNEYTELIKYSYDCLFTNDNFKNALKESIGYELDHSIGGTNPYKTIMTKKEFLDNLNRLRDMLKPPKFYNLFDL